MWTLDNLTLSSRLLVGTALYPSPEIMKQAIEASATQIVTVSLRRQSPDQKGGDAFWSIVKSLDVKVLPNTAGCRSAREAVTTARMAREVFNTHWIKLEVIGDDYNLQPNPFELVKAAQELIADGFCVFPYTTTDLVVAQTLVQCGCNIIMPWASPIGTGKGLVDKEALRTLRKRLPSTTLIIDAGIGLPSHACEAMELGYDGILLNSAVAQASDPVAMAQAFKLAVECGRTGYLAGPMEQRDLASPSTPTIGKPFWHTTTKVAQQ